jgi:hypothetical protein
MEMSVVIDKAGAIKFSHSGTAQLSLLAQA